MGDEDDESDLSDLILGTAVEALLHGGDEQAAVLLLDVRELRWIYFDTLFPMSGDGPATEMFELVLIVDRYLTSRFSDEVLERILPALNDAALSTDNYFRSVRVEAPLTEPGWRERAEARFKEGPTNQGVVGPPRKEWIVVDRMRFRDAAEVAVYRALRRAQDARQKDDSLTILPNPAARTRIDKTWEPDFVVAYRGRFGLIEVDGASHQGRAAVDRSRDRFFEDSGVAYLERISVEDTTSDADLDLLVERFLRKLGER